MGKEMDFLSLFKKYTVEQDLYYLIESCHTEEVVASRQKRVIGMTLCFFKLVKRDDIERLRVGIQNAYGLNDVLMRIKFLPELIDREYIEGILDWTLKSMPYAKAFLLKSTFTLDDKALTIVLADGGYELLESAAFGPKIEKTIFSETGEKFKVKFSGVLSVDEKNWSDCCVEAPAAFKQPAKTEKADTRPSEKETGKRIVMGKEIKETPVKLCEVTQESGKICVKGEVFFIQTREIKNGSLVVFTFDITDHTSSLRVSKIFKRSEYDKIKDEIKEGKQFLIRGEVEFNRFERDISMRPYDIVKISPVLSKDLAKEKRVELHLHTKMSSMDGINSIEDYVKRAAGWGHKAIAVTDHGVAQAFPDAMNAAKKYQIKMIYGIEAYFVNDTVPAVFGSKQAKFDDEFIVFDLETTGLNPKECAITEIGAVKVKNKEVIDVFNTYVNPERKIPGNITQLTGITDAMVKDAPKCDAALKAFYEFCGDRVLVAHNASFDVGFLKVWSQKYEIAFHYTYIDTLAVSRFLFKSLKKHKLDTIAKYLNLPAFNHHRASDDSKMLSDIFAIMLERLFAEYKIDQIAKINEVAAGGFNEKSKKAYHQIILVKNYEGLKNLYKLISGAHLDHYYKRPRILKSILMQHRDGLILGTACDAGEFYTAVREGRPYDELVKIAQFYDFLEIQPIANAAHLVRSGAVSNMDGLKEINKMIYSLGRKLNKPVVATGDVHFLNPEDEIYRRIIMSGQGFSDADEQAPLYFRTTDDMLQEFDYLGKEQAYEVVIASPNQIADLCEEIRPVPEGNFPPSMDRAPEDLEEMSRKRAEEIYGTPLPDIVKERLDKELESIIGHGFSVMYMIAQKLVKKSLDDGYLVGSRGSVGSSLVAFLSGITEVNALSPHYACPNCKYSEFLPEGAYETGVDMPDKNCPNCGTLLKKNGFDIPFETFLGFKGDKDPDIDLNFSGEYQSVAHKYTEELFGEGYVFRAGTIGTLAQKTAYGFVKKYLEEKGTVVTKAEENRLTIGCTGIKRTTGQHPGGVMIVPKHKEIFDFCPIQHPADDTESSTITTHFDYHSIHDNLLKLDILGHDDPTIIRMLEDLTGLDARTIRLDDSDTMEIFLSNKSLGIESDDIIGNVGTIAVPEFGTRFVRQMLEDTKPKTFIELINISGLSHGTDVWINNAQDLVHSKTASLSEVISTRDDIMRYLILKELPKDVSFTIMESVRKGKGLKDEWIDLMQEKSVPPWYIDSCKKIKYMFPKAHAVAYVMSAFRIAYFKVHYPKEFYAAYFTVRADEFDAKYMIHGTETIKAKIKEIEGNMSATTKEKNMITVLEVCYEMNKRGIDFCPIDIYWSHDKKFMLTPEGILPPLSALAGLGETAAKNIVEARKKEPFASYDDLRERAKVSKTVIEVLEEGGTLKSIPKSSQLSLFEEAIG